MGEYRYSARWLDGTENTDYENWYTTTLAGGKESKDPLPEHVCFAIILDTRKWKGILMLNCERAELPVVCISGKLIRGVFFM